MHISKALAKGLYLIEISTMHIETLVYHEKRLSGKKYLNSHHKAHCLLTPSTCLFLMNENRRPKKLFHGSIWNDVKSEVGIGYGSEDQWIFLCDIPMLNKKWNERIHQVKKTILDGFQWSGLGMINQNVYGYVM